MAEKFIQKATARMKRKGTLGKFGKATPAKIAAAKKEGGVRKKEAIFAENMKKIAAKRKRSGNSAGRHHLKKTRGDSSSHKAVGAQAGYTHL